MRLLLAVCILQLQLLQLLASCGFLLPDNPIAKLKNAFHHATGGAFNGSAATSLVSKVDHISQDVPSGPWEGVVEIPLMNSHNTQYIGKIGLGNPPQPVSVIFDTGSVNLIVSSSLCHSMSCHLHNRFQRSTTTSFHTQNQRKIQMFAGGSVDTVLGYDDLHIGNKTLHHQGFYEMETVSLQGYTMGSFDGVMGLGRASFQDESTTFLEKAGIASFSIWLSSRSGDAGLLLLGGQRDDLHTEPLTFLPVTHPYHWAVDLQAVRVGELEQECSGSCKAVIDSGTSLITFPMRYYLPVKQRIDVKSDCSNVDKLPPLDFKMSGRYFSLQPRDYILNITGQVLNDAGWYQKLDSLFTFIANRSLPHSCAAAVRSLDVQDQTTSKQEAVFILGDAFLRKYYTVYNREEKTIGLAAASQTVNGTAASNAPQSISAELLMAPGLHMMMGLMAT